MPESIGFLKTHKNIAACLRGKLEELRAKRASYNLINRTHKGFNHGR